MKTNQIFNFNNHEVRVVINDKNEPMFVAKDICNVLGYSNTNDAIIRHCKSDGVVKHDVIDSLGRFQNSALITEGNLYRLILKSKKEEAEKFENWVCDEVLPSIRKNGMYANDQTIEQMLTNPDFAIKTFEALKKERAEKERLQIQNQNQKEALQISAPKIEYYNEVLSSNSTYATTLIAKELGVSATALNRRLKELKVQYKQNEVWVLYSKYHAQGYTKTTTSTYTDSHGIIRTSMLTVWTEKGRLFIHELLKQLKSA